MIINSHIIDDSKSINISSYNLSTSDINKLINLINEYQQAHYKTKILLIDNKPYCIFYNSLSEVVCFYDIENKKYTTKIISDDDILEILKVNNKSYIQSSKYNYHIYSIKDSLSELLIHYIKNDSFEYCEHKNEDVEDKLTAYYIDNTSDLKFNNPDLVVIDSSSKFRLKKGIYVSNNLSINKNDLLKIIKSRGFRTRPSKEIIDFLNGKCSEYNKNKEMIKVCEEYSRIKLR